MVGNTEWLHFDVKLSIPAISGSGCGLVQAPPEKASLMSSQFDIKRCHEKLVTKLIIIDYNNTFSILFTIEPSIRGMVYHVTCAAHHRSALSRINYDSCICLQHSFPIYRVSMIIRLLSSSTSVPMQYS